MLLHQPSYNHFQNSLIHSCLLFSFLHQCHFQSGIFQVLDGLPELLLNLRKNIIENDYYLKLFTLSFDKIVSSVDLLTMLRQWINFIGIIDKLVRSSCYRTLSTRNIRSQLFKSTQQNFVFLKIHLDLL